MILIFINDKQTHIGNIFCSMSHSQLQSQGGFPHFKAHAMFTTSFWHEECNLPEGNEIKRTTQRVQCQALILLLLIEYFH